MPVDLAMIPAARLALLDTATLFYGAHSGRSGAPDCKHCARELIHEVVTGVHRDATPPGCTMLMSILPALNDGPWHDDAHRTKVMRPYLRKMLLLDPSEDERRIYAVVDHVYRKIMPDICDALKLDKHGSALRDLAPIIDRKSARAALAAHADLGVRGALDARGVRGVRGALDALDALAARADLAALADLAARAALTALAARGALAAHDARAQSWERGVREVLDLVCTI